MELLTGLAVGWQQRLHSVKVPQTKGGAPRLHRSQLSPACGDFQRGRMRFNVKGLLFVSGCPFQPLPWPLCPKTKTRTGRCHICWAEGEGGDPLETGNEQERKMSTLVCVEEWPCFLTPFLK